MKVSGNTIKRLRESKGWLQSDLATHAGLSRPFITQVENGTREPGAVALTAIARALDIGSEDLVVVEITCPHCGHVFEV